MASKVLILSDNQEAARIWAFALRQRGHQSVEAASITEALRGAVQQLPDLVVADACSTLDGIEVCRRLRAQGVNPILLLTCQTDESYLLQAYEAGADECVSKPVSPLLFLAKVNSWLRRSWTVPTEALDALRAGEIELDPETRQLTVGDGVTHKLTNLEFRLLHCLMGHAGQVLEPDYLIDRVWGHDGGDAGMLKNLVYRLRRKIEPPDSRRHLIATVSGRGYRFQPSKPTPLP